jgi:hypothetical protein
VSFPPQLELETSIRKWGNKQFAVSTVKATTEERPKGSRQVKAPARLGHYTSGKKGIDTSVGATTFPKLREHSDDDEDSDNHDKMCAGHIPPEKQRSHLIPGRYSLIRPGDVEELHDQLSSTTDDAPLQELDVAKKRPTAKSYFNKKQGSGSILHSSGSESVPATKDSATQELMHGDLLISDENLMKRKRVASNAQTRKIPRGTVTGNSQVTNIAVESSAEFSSVEDPLFAGHKSVLFYAYVEKKQQKDKIILDYLDPPVHEESILPNETMSPADFVLKPSTHDKHLLSKNERDFCIDSIKRLKFI